MKYRLRLIMFGLCIVAIGFISRETQAQSPCQNNSRCIYIPALLKNFDPSIPPTATPNSPTATSIAPTPTATSQLTPTTQPTPTINPTPLPTVAQPNVNAEFVDFTVSIYKTVATNDRTAYENIFKYFADGLYEMTNGAYKVRKITIYQNGQFSDKANVVWNNSEWPRASISGYNGGGQVMMGDIFPFGTPYDALTASNQKGAGYTLAHEWGHYQFGVRDEYKGTSNSNDPGQPKASDITIQSAIMGGGNWNAVSGSASFLNLSTAQDYPQAGTTAQHRVYAASCWETVARSPSLDPRSGSSSASTRYDYSTLLSKVAPTNEVKIELPSSAAQSALNITWAAADAKATKYRQLLIDISADMGTNNRLASVKMAAKNYVDQTSDGDYIGIVTYGASFVTVQPMTQINASNRASLKATIDTLVASNSTTRLVTEADLAAVNAVAAAINNAVIADKAVYLFVSGAFDDTGNNPYQTLLDQHQSIPLTIFDYSPPEVGVSNVLQQVAEFSNGQYKYVGGVTTIDITGRRRSRANVDAKSTQLVSAMIDADQQGSQMVEVNLGVGSGDVPMGQSADPVIYIDSTLDKVVVLAMYAGQVNEASVTLENPNGIQADAPQCQSDGAETVCMFELNQPKVGEWQLLISPLTRTLSVEYRAKGYAYDGFTYQASLQSITGDYINYPEPILLVAKLSRIDPIAKAAANAYVKGPDGKMIYGDNNPLELKDDGVAPDVDADDGLYTAFLPYSQEGDYYVMFIFDNIDRKAVFTQNSFEHTPGPGLDLNFPPDRPVTDDFDRFATLELFVNNMQADDHGDTPAKATVLTPDNVDVPGRIDRAGDVDTFKITATSAATMSIRLSGLALGMKANIKITKPDGSQADFTLTNPDAGYFWQSFAANPGEVFYVQISHIDGQAKGGTYNLSAGTPLAAEMP